MLNKRQFVEEQKDCASMLGLTLEEYRKSLKNVKVGSSDEKRKNIKYDNSILDYLGIDERLLKKKKV